MLVPVILDGLAVLQYFRAGSDQGQQMLCKTLPKFNRPTDLKEEKDLKVQSEEVAKLQLQRKECGCAFSLPTYLPLLRQAKYDITLDVLQVECGSHD